MAVLRALMIARPCRRMKTWIRPALIGRVGGAAA
jgi:hypothetical protein